MPLRPHIPRALLVPLAALCAGILVAACGGSSTPARSASLSGSAVKFAGCMRTHGVPDFPDPSQAGGGGTQINESQSSSANSISVDGVTLNVSAPAFQKAMSECAKDQPQGPALSAAQIAKIRASALAMAKCMRSHGVPNFPDPDVGTGPSGRGVAVKIGASAAGGAGSLNPQSPAFQQAASTCMPLMKRGLASKKSS